MSYLAEKKLVTSIAPSTYRIRDVSLLASLAGIDPPCSARFLRTRPGGGGQGRLSQRARAAAG